MKWDRLKYFHIVSQTLNLKKASDIMNISHSSLSRQISVLENEMKMKLFFVILRGYPYLQRVKIYLKKLMTYTHELKILKILNLHQNQEEN